MFRTLRSRLVLLALAWLVPVVLSSLAAAWWSYQASLEAEHESNLDLARTAAASFRAYVDGLVDESAVLGAAIAGEGLDHAATTRLLGLAAARRPAVRWFLWADADGAVLAASDRRLVGKAFGDRDYVRELQGGAERALGDLAGAKLDGRPVFGLALAVRDEAGTLEHMVIAAVDPEKLNVRAFAGLRPQRATVTLLDGTGRVIYRTAALRPGWEDRRQASTHTSVRRALAGLEETAIEVSAIEGDRRVAAAVPVAPFGWVARAATPVSTVVAPLRRDVLLRASVVVVLALGGVAASFVIGRWIVSPLRRLGAQAAAWRNGVHGERVADGPEEVRAFSAAFEEMSRGLAEERRRLEVALGSLRDGDRRKDEFLAVLSHELRNPLAPIRNSLTILERVEPGSEQARRAQAVIGRQVAHVTRLVDDLLDVSRIARGKIALQRAPLDLAEVVRHVAEDHAPLFEASGLRFRAELPGAPVPVEGDEVRLAQVIGNLLHNASRFTPRDGEVRLVLSVGEERATVRVVDTGAGIHPDVRTSLFQPFMQGPQGPARSHGGLGLGLALVKGLAELHGGSVEAHSEGPGRGAEFRVHLPVGAAIAA